VGVGVDVQVSVGVEVFVGSGSAYQSGWVCSSREISRPTPTLPTQSEPLVNLEHDLLEFLKAYGPVSTGGYIKIGNVETVTQNGAAVVIKRRAGSHATPYVPLIGVQRPTVGFLEL
jgi:hypothetical protein